MIGPPSRAWTSADPTYGVRAMIEAPMPSPQYASWSHRNTWPVNAIPSVHRKRRTPATHVSSRGYLWAPHRKTWIMCSVITMTMAFEPQKWIARRYQPSAAW